MKNLVTLLMAVGSFGCAQVPMHGDLLSAFPLAQESVTANNSGSNLKHKPASPTHSARRDQLTRQASKAEESGDYQQAIAQYTELTNIFPHDTETLHRLAVLQDNYGDPSQSARYYVRALHHAPEDAGLLCDYGYSRYLQDDFNQAEALLRRAIALDSKLERAQTNLGLVLARQGKDEPAIAAFRKAGLSMRQSRENLRQTRLAVHPDS